MFYIYIYFYIFDYLHLIKFEVHKKKRKVTSYLIRFQKYINTMLRFDFCLLLRNLLKTWEKVKIQTT